MDKSDGLEVGDELGGEVCKLILGRELMSNLGSCRRCATELRVEASAMVDALSAREKPEPSKRAIPPFSSLPICPALVAGPPGELARRLALVLADVCADRIPGYQIGTFCVEGTPPNPPTGVSRWAPGGGG